LDFVYSFKLRIRACEDFTWAVTGLSPYIEISNKEINTFGFSSPLKISTSHYGNKI
jgi:hypothetical protein